MSKRFESLTLWCLATRFYPTRGLTKDGWHRPDTDISHIAPCPLLFRQVRTAECLIGWAVILAARRIICTRSISSGAMLELSMT